MAAGVVATATGNWKSRKSGHESKREEGMKLIHEVGLGRFEPYCPDY